jgi:hypothetical protein
MGQNDEAGQNRRFSRTYFVTDLWHCQSVDLADVGIGVKNGYYCPSPEIVKLAQRADYLYKTIHPRQSDFSVRSLAETLQ